MRQRAGLILGLLALGLAGSLGDELSRARPRIDDAAELSLFPSGRLLRILSMGQPTLLADVAWLAAIQYYGKHHLGDRLYPLARHLFEVTTEVDPSFRSAYVFGGLVVAEEVGDIEGARRIFKSGIRANPEDWMLAFQRGFIEYTRGDAAVGATLMQRASRMPGAPAYTIRLAAHACARAGRRELAIRLWEEIARGSEDPALRALAQERLRDFMERSGTDRTEGRR